MHSLVVMHERKMQQKLQTKELEQGVFQWPERGRRRKIGGAVCLLRVCFRCGLAWLGLACLLALAAVVHECLWSGGVGWGCVEVAGRAVLGDTAVHLPDRTLGASHTPDDDLA